MGRIAGVRYESLAGVSDHGFLFRFGARLNSRSVWIYRGHIYRFDRLAQAIAIPESLIVEKVLDAFLADVYPSEEVRE